jgi:hypothetical protein
MLMPLFGLCDNKPLIPNNSGCQWQPECYVLNEC